MPSRDIWGLIPYSRSPVYASVLIVFSQIPNGSAQGVATQQQLEAVTGTGMRSMWDLNLPMTTAGKTTEALREQGNIFNPEDVLRNMPSTMVRKRYSGDRNAAIAGRNFAVRLPRESWC